jgi:putative membrane protein
VSDSDFDQDRPLEKRDYSRRTLLAIERTYLAWWRTGLTSLAVALATARVVPDLAKSKVQWPYTLVGIGFALLGCVCLGYGEYRRRSVGRAVVAGEFEEVNSVVALVLTIGGVALGLALVVVLAIEP